MRLVNDNEWFYRTEGRKWGVKLIIKQAYIISIS